MARGLKAVCVSLAAAFLMSGHTQAENATPRTELAIREVRLSDGTRRYTVPLVIDGVTLEAGLDTGSTGLRILSSGLTGAKPEVSTTSSTYAYSSGVRYTGLIARANIGLGAITGTVPFQVIKTVDCLPKKPDCPARHVDFEHYGIQGNGLSDEGFKAIIGTNMADDQAPNPLVKLGVKRWIVELPQPRNNTKGKLILNPSDDDVSGYVMFHVDQTFSHIDGGLHDAISGCLINTQTHQQLCGPTLLDCGQPGIRAVTSDGLAPWANNTPAQIVFLKDNKPAMTANLIIGRRELASHFMTETHPVDTPRLFPGIMPYFLFDVLYDAEHQEIGLKMRSQP